MIKNEIYLRNIPDQTLEALRELSEQEGIKQGTKLIDFIINQFFNQQNIINKLKVDKIKLATSLREEEEKYNLLKEEITNHLELHDRLALSRETLFKKVS